MVCAGSACLRILEEEEFLHEITLKKKIAKQWVVKIRNLNMHVFPKLMGKKMKIMQEMQTGLRKKIHIMQLAYPPRVRLAEQYILEVSNNYCPKRISGNNFREHTKIHWVRKFPL